MLGLGSRLLIRVSVKDTVRIGVSRDMVSGYGYLNSELAREFRPVDGFDRQWTTHRTTALGVERLGSG